MWQTLLNSSWFTFSFAVLLLLSICCGIFYATRYKKKANWESSGVEAAIVGIFGLIISFTFLQAGNAHRERYANIHKEAINIEMLYRYSKEMPDSFQRYTRQVLTSFLDNQLDYEKTGDRQFFFKAKKISDSYWEMLRSYNIQSSDFGNTHPLNKISDCFDQVQSSVSLYAYADYERTPPFIMFLLVTVASLIGFLVGFMNGIKPKTHYLVPTIYFVLITLTIMVISDLNNPRMGFIKPSYHHLKVTQEYIRNN